MRACTMIILRTASLADTTTASIRTRAVEAFLQEKNSYHLRGWLGTPGP